MQTIPASSLLTFDKNMLPTEATPKEENSIPNITAPFFAPKSRCTAGGAKAKLPANVKKDRHVIARKAF